MDKPYQRKQGEFEIRILPDGRLVFVAPDEALTDVAERLEQPEETQELQKERHCNGPGKTDRK